MLNFTNEQQLTQYLELLEKRVKELESAPITKNNHTHDGINSFKIIHSDINQKKIEIFHTIYGTGAATATNYGIFFIAPWTCRVMKFQEVHQTAGSDGGAVTLDLEKLTGTQAPDAGTALLSSTLSLKATANTVQTGTLTATTGNLLLATGDRLCLKDAGVMTAVDNLTIMLQIQITQNVV